MIAYRIAFAHRLLVLRYAGEVAIEDWRDTMARIIAENPAVPGFDSLVDVRDLTTFHTSQEVRDHVRDVQQLGMQDQPRRTAVVVSNEAHFGLSRMFEFLIDPQGKVERHTTRSLKDAAAWLGRPVELIEAELAAVAAAKTTDPGRSG